MIIVYEFIILRHLVRISLQRTPTVICIVQKLIHLVHLVIFVFAKLHYHIHDILLHLHSLLLKMLVPILNSSMLILLVLIQFLLLSFFLNRHIFISCSQYKYIAVINFWLKHFRITSQMWKNLRQFIIHSIQVLLKYFFVFIL